jgi:alkaline phosphatase D
MEPISRRVLLAGSAVVVLASCSSNAKSSARPTLAGSTTAAPITPPPADTSTTVVAGTAPPGTAPATTTPTTGAPPATRPIELPGNPFTLGVASGEPGAGSVVLWTRLAPSPLDGGGMPSVDVPVTWELSADQTFASIAESGVEVATAAYGHSVHAHVTLGAGEWFYRFRVGTYTSPIGATRAAPDDGAAVASLRFVSASCQNYENGFYAAHRDIAEQKPDFVVWLGDYIYEYAGGAAPVGANVRTHASPEATTLAGYRHRYALYKGDVNLQAAHAACPWYVIWDDHEVQDNYAGETPSNPAEAAAFPARRAAAYQAWWEHQPVALPPPPLAGEYRTYRAVHWGSLLKLALLDTRQYRSDQACGDVVLKVAPPCPEVTVPGRTLTGAEQEAWLFDELDTNTRTWNVIGQQIVFGDATLNGVILNFDQWDGYPEQRQRIHQHLADHNTQNVVVLSGDIHLAGTGTIRLGDRTTGQPLGVEFVATSISSDGLVPPDFVGVVKAIPSFLDVELAHRGYILHTVSPTGWRAEYRIVDDVKQADSKVSVFQTYAVDAGTNTVRFARG